MTGAMALFDRFFDDAALFPPGNAPMPQAIPAHGQHHAAWYAAMVGPFVLPDTRLHELPDLDAPLAISLIAASADGLAAARADARVRVAAVETRDPDLVVDATPSYVEFAWPDLPGAIEGLPAGTRAKLRTGGTVATAFPTEAQLAAAIDACVRRGMPFKCTAGLHEAIRHTDASTGFEHHGYLNVLLATATASRGGDVERALAERDPARVVEELDDPTITLARKAFLSFGTCSIVDPVNDLVRLGLVATGE